MQEFSSVTASSYDPNALVALLNDSAAEGWDVVSIVGAGTNIVAYLTREASEGSAPDTAVEAGAVEAGADDRDDVPALCGAVVEQRDQRVGVVRRCGDR